jgi:hypothetical protein
VGGAAATGWVVAGCAVVGECSADLTVVVLRNRRLVVVCRVPVAPLTTVVDVSGTVADDSGSCAWRRFASESE